MNLIPVNSSNLSAIGYDSGTLYVRFNSGHLYTYSNVPEFVYKNLMGASSKGSYFAANIKNYYRCTQIY